MCPLRIANIAILTTTSTGAMSALVLKIFRGEKEPNRKAEEHEISRNGKVQSGVAERVGGCETTTSCEGKGNDPRRRHFGRRASANAVDECGEELRVRWAQR